MTRQAIILTSDFEGDTFAPHAVRVAGQSMLKRTLMMLQWAGIHEALVVVGPWDQDRSRVSLLADRDLDPDRMQIRWIEDEGAAARGGLSAAAAATEVQRKALVLRADTVYDKGIVTDMLKKRVRVGGGVVAVSGDRGLGLVLLDAEALAGLDPARTFGESLDAFITDRPVERLDVGARLWGRVHDEESARRLEDALWNSCRKPIDGIIARNLNRHVSLFISRRIAHLPIHPNHISIVTFALGIATALAIAQGTYGWFVLGAALFKLNSILDGVDGELARVKFQMSVTGEWLDTLSDDVSNLLFFVGLTIGAYRLTGSELWVTLGLVTAVPFMISAAYQYTILIKGGRGDLLAIRWFFERGHGKGGGQQSAGSRLLDSLKYIVKKDFFVFAALVAAILGYLPWMLFLTATANIILLGTIIAQELVFLRLRRTGARVERVLNDKIANVTASTAAGTKGVRREAVTVTGVQR